MNLPGHVRRSGRRGRRRGYQRLTGWLCLLLCLGTAMPMPAQGDEAGTGYRSKQWSIFDNAPPDIWALAQSADGYLWLGTGNGLYRFDGVQFERYRPPAGEAFRSNNITALRLAADGALWMGFYSGGVSVLRDGHLRHYPAGAGMPPGMVIALAQTRDGAIWVACEGGLGRFADGRWQTVGSDWGYPTHHADWLLVGHDGSLWVATGNALVLLPAGARRFQPTSLDDLKFAVLAQAGDGTLWVSDHQHGTRALPGMDTAHPMVTLPTEPTSDYGWAQRLLIDRYGNLWSTGVDDGGIYRVADAARFANGHALQPQQLTQRIDRASGLLTNRTVPLLEDAEGTLWAGTNMGLVSFRRNRVALPAGIPIGVASNYAMARDNQGSVWIANSGQLWRMQGEQAQWVRGDLNDIHAALFDRADRLWMIGRHWLFVLDGSDLSRYRLPETGSHTSALAIDADGAPLVAIAHRGLYRLQQGQWQPVVLPAPVQRLVPTTMTLDPQGRLWLGYADNLLARWDGHRLDVYTSADGLAVGNLTTLEASGEELLIGGELGLARWKAGRVSTLGPPGQDVFTGISGIVHDRAGDLWINAEKGVLQIAAAAAERAFATPGSVPPYRLFDYGDGLPGIAMQVTEVNSALRDGTQRLWFLTNQGPAWIGPGEPELNHRPPTVIVQTIEADGRLQAATSGLRLAKGTNTLRLRYTATSLARPGRVLFRYRLLGVDQDWQDAGTRREAFYANVGPGDYRFQVIAANEDGVWNTRGATVAFSIAPWFYQTWWFKAAAALAAAGLLYLAYRRRLRQLGSVMAARLLERQRIARDLHDTLLQSLHIVLLRVKLATDAINDSPARAGLEQAMQVTRQALLEGTDKILTLRGGCRADEQLPERLAQLGAMQAGGSGTQVRLQLHGTVRPLNAVVEEELYALGSEMLSNAIRHARASEVLITLDYARRRLWLVVRDNGIGFVPDAPLKPSDSCGWGLPGMRERARRLSARLLIDSAPGQGTRISVRVPGSIAYGFRLRWLGR